MDKQRRIILGSIFTLAAAGAVALPSPANAYWYGYYRPGFVVGVVPPPVYVPPPAYYAPPPVVYAPPPVTYAPPPGPQAYAGGSCNAGSIMCPMEVSRPVGATCYCGTPGGRVYGSVR